MTWEGTMRAMAILEKNPTLGDTDPDVVSLSEQDVREIRALVKRSLDALRHEEAAAYFATREESRTHPKSSPYDVLGRNQSKIPIRWLKRYCILDEIDVLTRGFGQLVAFYEMWGQYIIILGFQVVRQPDGVWLIRGWETTNMSPPRDGAIA